jgi:hypothetical protein
MEHTWRQYVPQGWRCRTSVTMHKAHAFSTTGFTGIVQTRGRVFFFGAMIVSSRRLQKQGTAGADRRRRRKEAA